ncbi:MAG TPA: DUF3267 domain-containing protein [Thermoanaerobaculia bacterium]|jgi:hypothetical protein|nr:DUF3267 domain-containing protein [Thermoanaerobaculia bacterium]
MRFVHGAVPEDPDFHPEEEGWNAIREPDPIQMQIVALPVMLATAALLFVVIAKGTDVVWRDVAKYIGPAFVLMIPIHELIHAFANPRFGLTPRTYVGVWPSRLLFYAHYEGELPRERFLGILIAPTLVLTVLPLLLCLVFRWNSSPLAALALANGLGAAGDLLGMIIVLRQIPRGTLVRNKGWRTYWRERVRDGSAAPSL